MLLLADSSHTLTDVLASVVVIIGFVGTELGYLYADPASAVVVCVIIVGMGVSIFKETSRGLVDTGIPADVISRIKTITRGIGNGLDCHSVRGRKVGNKMFIDMHLTVKGDESIENGHAIAEALEDELKRSVEGIEEVIIHVEPKERGKEGKN